MYLDGIDIDREVRDEIFSEDVDAMYEEKARCAEKYRLLAVRLAVLFEKYHVVNPDAIKKFLDRLIEKRYRENDEKN